MAHDEALMRAFIRPQVRGRYAAKVHHRKGRAWVTDRLHHLQDLDERFAQLVPIDLQTPDGVYRLLKSKGAPETCYVLGGGDLDGRELRLREALEQVVGQGYGVMVSCIEGRLAFFEREGNNERFILERP